VIISLLRKIIPSRVRIIIYMITIASGVTIVDLVLKAYWPTVSEAMGPYVPLIITNCIIMGRAEAFFVQNPPKLALIDALANGLAYTYTLMAIAIFREIFAFGTLLGVRVTPSGWVDWVVLAAPAGAFFVLGVFLWITRTAAGIEPPKSS
jgi:Na+-transporting NADH:ubiquinone oxidoreductase subunit D